MDDKTLKEGLKMGHRVAPILPFQEPEVLEQIAKLYIERAVERRKHSDIPYGSNPSNYL